MRRLSALSAVLISLFASILGPAKATDAPPVTVQACSIDTRDLFFVIDFTNASTQEITNINFEIADASGALFMRSEAGSFAPGVLVRRNGHQKLAQLQNIQDDFVVQCIPTTVTFRDGTTWQNPTVAGDMEHALPQTPGSRTAFSTCYAIGSAVGNGNAVGDYNNPGAGTQVHYAFRNAANLPITRYEFGFMEDGTIVFRKVDTGTFAPGDLVERTYASPIAQASDLLHQQCVVLSATYADGSVWQNPSPAATATGVPIAPSTGNGSITVLGCKVTQTTIMIYGQRSPYDGFQVDYRDDSFVGVTSVDFALVNDGLIEGVGKDIHTLTPHDETTRAFWLAPHEVAAGAFWSGSHDATCVPIRVNYANGSVWVNPAVASL